MHAKTTVIFNGKTSIASTFQIEEIQEEFFLIVDTLPDGRRRALRLAKEQIGEEYSDPWGQPLIHVEPIHATVALAILLPPP